MALLLNLSCQYLREARFRDSLLASARGGMLVPAGKDSCWRVKAHYGPLPCGQEVHKPGKDALCTPDLLVSSPRMPQDKVVVFANPRLFAKARRSAGKPLPPRSTHDSPRSNAAPVSFNWTSMLEASDEMKQTTCRLAAAQQAQQHDWGMTKTLAFAAANAASTKTLHAALVS